MQDILSALPALLEKFEENETVREAVVFAVWRQIAGENLRGNAVPFRLFQKQLVIAVRNETWKKQLEDLSGQMLFKLNSALKQAVVTFIEFRVDEETVAAERKKLRPERCDSFFHSLASNY